MDYTQVPERLRTGNRVRVVESFDGLPIGVEGTVISHNCLEIRIRYDVGCIMTVGITTADRCLTTARRLTG